MMRKKSVLALVLMFGLLAAACTAAPPPAPSATDPQLPAPTALPAAPAAGEADPPSPPSQEQPSASEQSPLPPETPAGEGAQAEKGERPESLPPSSGSGEAEPFSPPQSSRASSESSSQPDLPSGSDPQQDDPPEALPSAQEQQGDPPGSRWLTISEATVLTLINKERGRLGVQPLTFDPDLTAAARVRAAEMFRGNYLSSSRPDGSPWETVLGGDGSADFSLAAENRAWTDHAAGQDVPPFQWFQVWQQGESQYAAMVDPRYTHCGVAVLAGPYFDGEQSYALALFRGD